MLETLNRPEFFVILLALMLLAVEIGRKNRRSWQKLHPEDTAALGPVETVIFALLGLLLAFTFTGSWSRFEERRKLITAETNAIRTVYLRIDMMSEDAQPPMRYLLKQYTSLRMDIYKNAEEEVISGKYGRGKELRQAIWDAAVADSKRENRDVFSSSFILSAINNLYDVAAIRVMARQNHPPVVIYIMLIVLTLFSAFLVGYSMPPGGRRLLYVISYALVISSVLYLIIEIEMPRHGLITVHEDDQMLEDLRDLM